VTNGTKELQNLFDGSSPFTFPKPTTLISGLLQICTRPGDIVLDFFAGSATTAHACLLLGCSDPASRRFVMVQLPEPCDGDPAAATAGFSTIADIGKERIRRAIARLGEQGGNRDDTDLGLKVFKLDSSNIIGWDASPEDLEGALFDAVQIVKPDRSEQDVLYELLLKYGLDLAVRVERRDVAGASAFVIGGGALVVCLSDDVSLELAEGVATIKAELSPEVMRVVFKDAGFPSDVVKANTVQILHQAGIDDVKSL